MPQIQNYDKALMRLMLILQKMSEGETVYISELAEEFGVSARTVQRDLNERLIRFPIEKHGQGWRMKKGFCAEKTRDAKDTLVIDILSEVAISVGGSFAARATALLSRLKNKDKNPFYSKHILEDISGSEAVLDTLQTGINNSLIVGFFYKQKHRTVKPYRIVSFEGFWYLYGEDVMDGRVKTFYLRDIPSAYLSKERFEPDTILQERLEGAINAWFEPDHEPFAVRVLASKEIAKYFDRKPISKTQRIVKRCESGDVELEFEASSENEVLYEIKKWIPNLVVLSPKELGMRLKDISEEFSKRQVEVLVYGK